MKKLICLIILFNLSINLVISQEVAKLHLSAFEVKDENNELSLKVNDKNNIFFNGQYIGNVNSNAEFTDKDNNLIAKIDDENYILNKEGERLIIVGDNGQLNFGDGILLRWTIRGEMLMGEENTTLKIYPNDSELYKVASTIFFMLFYLDAAENVNVSDS